MRLKELLKGIYEEELEDRFSDFEVSSLCCDSRQVEKNSLFIALEGDKLNGVHFIDDAIGKGAKVIVLSQQEKIDSRQENICYLFVKHPKVFLKEIALRFYGYPSKDVRVIGVTGTNGKTTTTYLIESLFHVLGEECGVVGTINMRIGKKEYPSVNTTPSFLDNQKFLFELKKRHISYCVMEVSSHGLDQGRVDGIDFREAVFTNLTQDHLDYHKTMEGYFQAKVKLFSHLSEKSFALINQDDPYAEKFKKNSLGKILTYGIVNNSDIRAGKIQAHLSSTEFELYTPQGSIFISSRLVGRHNIYNILTAVSVGCAEGISLQNIKKGIEALHYVPGRLEPVFCGQKFSVLIDYAHTPDALENVLKTLKQFKDKKIILVFGCGGDRDKTKRPLMGKIAGQLADFSVITTDNPRSEEPQDIIRDIVSGFETKNYECIVDRTDAICQALKIANDNSIVLIAGKGHEMYQIFKDRKINYDERKIIKDFFHV